MDDWKEGAISSKFILNKLKQANERINTFVEDEVPCGWKCVWDRFV